MSRRIETQTSRTAEWTCLSRAASYAETDEHYQSGDALQSAKRSEEENRMDNASTLGVLRQLERGEISAAEADTRLTAPPQIERVAAPPFDQMQIPRWVQHIWITVLMAGIGAVLFGTWIVAATVRVNILWLLLGLPIVLLGSLLIAIGAGGFSGHWLYVNVEQSRTRRHSIRFALPFPLGLLRLGLWLAHFVQPRPRARIRVSTARSKFDALRDDPDELIDALERELVAGRGMTIDVDDKDERVQVYIV